jgi:hypothetical protein
MKFNSQDDGKEMDMENLDSIIKRCEEAMGKKFSKPGDEGSPEEEGHESPEEEKGEHDDMDESDLNDLLDMYKKLKG